MSAAHLLVPVSPGELIDKITILEIKLERLQDPEKQRNVVHELTLLRSVREAGVASSETLEALTRALGDVNQRLWDVEDQLRDCERAADFGATFVSLARSVYRHNDERASLKRRINELLGSTLVEEKSYAAY